MIVSPGAQNGLFAAVPCLAEAGDQVIILEPYYATYAAVAQAGGASVRRVPLDADLAFRIGALREVAILRDACRRIADSVDGLEGQGSIIYDNR